MKKNGLHIIYTWIVLICFIAGQVMVYAHQHKANPVVNNTHKTTTNPDQKTITEKCQLCDAMHNNQMLLSQQAHFNPAVVTTHFYVKGDYTFISIALILSAGRSPPGIS